MSGTTWTIKSKRIRKGTKDVYYVCTAGDPATTRTFHEHEVMIRTFAGEVFTTEQGRRIHFLIKSVRSDDPTKADNLADVVQVDKAEFLEIVHQVESDERLKALREALQKHWPSEG